jgi:amino acid adenylation domain-containing protein
MELGCSALIQAKIGRGNTKMQPDSTITLSKKLMDMTIYSTIASNAQYVPQANVVGSPGREFLTYSHLFDHINTKIRILRAIGLKRNDRVAIVMPNGSEMATVFLTIASFAIAAPLNPAYRESEFEFFLSNLNATAVIVQADTDSLVKYVAIKKGIPIIEIFPTVDAEAGLFNIKGEKNNLISAPSEAAGPDDIAVLLHTSGTTSRPKLVPLTNRNICFAARNICQALKLSESDQCLNVMPLFHIHGLVGALLSSLMAGGSVACSPGFYINQFFDWIAEFQPTWFTAVPTMLQGILNRAKSHNRIIRKCPLRFIRSCSAALPPTVMKEMEYLFNVPVIESYGMTEASHQIASNPLPPQKRKPSSVGIATGPQIAIMDEFGKILSANQTGEIVIRGHSITKGYENNLEANEASFTNGWFRTGDQGYLDTEGYLYITGRIKEIINRGGEKIAPFEIDNILLKHPAVQQAVTFPITHPSLGEDVVAAVVLKKTRTVTQQELQSFVAKHLADFKIPRRIIFLSDIPKGPTGKIQRLKLAAQLKLSAEKAPKSNFPKPGTMKRSAWISTLMEIWKAVMGLTEIDPDDNFFQMGGDSIQAAQILARVKNTFGVELSYVIFLNAPTVDGMASAIADLQKTPASRKTVPTHSIELSTAIGNRDEPFPLNDIQQAYWAGRSGNYELGGVSAHAYLEVDCTELNLQRLSHALNQLIKRHDMLRAVVKEDGLQQILRQVPEYQIKSNDLRHLSQDQVTERLSSIRQQMSHQLMPSNRWPLFEVRASQIEHQRTRLHFSFDGLIMDAWSRNIFFKELIANYKQPNISFDPIEISFRDYVLAGEALRNTDQYQQSMQYWRDRFFNLPFPPELPIVKDDYAQSRTRFQRLTSEILPEDWQQLKNLAKEAGFTPSVLLLAGFAEVISVWSKAPRFLLNVPHFNRLQIHPQVNEIIGQFASLTFLEVDTSNEKSFKERAQQIQKQLWVDLEHGITGGVAVLRELSKYWNQAGQAVLPVVFTSAPQGLRENSASTPKAMGDVVYSISQTPQVWLDCQVHEESGLLVVDWNWVEALFPEGMAKNMFKAYTGQLTALAKDESTWRRRHRQIVQFLIPSEQLEQRKNINANLKKWPDDLLQESFIEHVRRQPQQPAVIDARRTLSYEELFLISNRVAYELLAWDLPPNTLIAIEMQKGWEQIAAVLGILLSGAAYLPIDPDQPDKRMQHILRDGRVGGVLKQSWSASKVSDLGSIRTIYIDKLPIDGDVVSARISRKTPSDMACVIYTSGSTGKPKGVMISHRGVANAIRFTNHRFPVRADDRILALTPIFHDMSLYDLFGTLAAGATIILPDPQFRKDPLHWVDAMVRHKVTLWNSVPTMLQVLVEYLGERNDLTRPPIRLAFVGGETVTPTLANRFTALFNEAQMVSVGGPTETTLWNIMHPIESSDIRRQKIPYGKPISNSQYYVLNESMVERPVWVTGELYCAGVGLAKGYWNDDQKTESSFIRHPDTGERLYKTGDLGRYLPDGNIEILGRTDFQLKIRGHRIEAGEVEFALSEHSSVQTSLVKAVKDPEGGYRLVAYVVKKSEYKDDLNYSELQTYLRQRLPEQMIPSAFIVMDKMPLLPNGKVDHRSLPLPEVASTISLSAPIWENEDVSACMKEIVSRVLRIEVTDPDVNWFSLGATSIDIIRILNRLEQELSFRPRIDQVYQAPSISGLIDAYQRNRIIDQGFEPACEPIPASYTSKSIMIKDPLEREKFRISQPGIRSTLPGLKGVKLDGLPDSKSVRAAYSKRRSYRKFEKDPISFENFSKFIGCLRQIRVNDNPKYLYPSAGGLYSVQTYFYIKHGRIDGLTQGSYYYHPIQHCLYSLMLNARLDRTIYGRLYNRAIFDEAAFAIFLIVDLDAIFPMYGPNSVHLATLDSGYMSQLLTTTAIEHRIGLCPIGSLNFTPVRHLFSLKKGQILLHSLLGGGISFEENNAKLFFSSDRFEDIEEGEI